MPVTSLNHFLLVAKDLERTKDFYQRVLGMEVDAARPDFGFPGYWLKANGETCVHLASQAPNRIRDQFLLKKHPKGTAGSDAVDRFDDKRMPSRARAARPCATQKKPPNESGAHGCRRGAVGEAVFRCGMQVTFRIETQAGHLHVAIDGMRRIDECVAQEVGDRHPVQDALFGQLRQRGEVRLATVGRDAQFDVAVELHFGEGPADGSSGWLRRRTCPHGDLLE